jgi:hypothetical protein
MTSKRPSKRQKEQSKYCFYVQREKAATRVQREKAAERRKNYIYRDMPGLAPGTPPTSEDELDLSSEDELDLSSEDKLKQIRVYEINWKKLKEAGDAKDAETCEKLKNLFHMAMLMGSLPYLKTRKEMMNYLNTQGDPLWTVAHIWCLADSNKIDWVKGSGDPQSYETYKAAMNRALAKVLRP